VNWTDALKEAVGGLRVPTLRKETTYGEMLPPWYGYAWENYTARVRVCYPIPLNVLLATFRGLHTWFKYGFLGVPYDPRDAYRQGYEQALKDVQEAKRRRK
jgi:hypothetical protein